VLPNHRVTARVTKQTTQESDKSTIGSLNNERKLKKPMPARFRLAAVAANSPKRASKPAVKWITTEKTSIPTTILTGINEHRNLFSENL
jgi:hypothetical protein